MPRGDLATRGGVFDGLAAHIRDLLERDIAYHGWRFDTIPFLWPIGVDTAVENRRDLVDLGRSQRAF